MRWRCWVFVAGDGRGGDVPGLLFPWTDVVMHVRETLASWDVDGRAGDDLPFPRPSGPLWPVPGALDACFQTPAALLVVTLLGIRALFQGAVSL